MNLRFWEKGFWGKKAARMYSTGYPSQIINGTLITPSDNKETYITEGYTYNDIIYAIINLISDKVRLPEWNQYKVVDEGSLKSYIGLMKKKDLSSEDFKRANDLKKKALELIPGDSKLADLLKWANDKETFGDFVANGTAYKLITGDRMVWAEMLTAGANTGKPYQLHNLPTHKITIEANNVFPASAVRYKLFEINKSWEASEVLHESFFNPEYYTNGHHLYGLSPLKAALYTYQRNNSGKLRSKAAFDNGTATGIISPDINPELVTESNVAIMLDQASKVKQMLTGKEYAGAENGGKTAASGYRMHWTEIGLSPVDLNILEGEKWDLNRLCAVYGVPSVLLGNDKSSTYNNVREAEKALTARVALPLLTSFRNYFNKKLQTDWGFKGQNIYVDFDQTVFTELDENTKDKVEWVSKLWMLSPNKQLELLGLEKVEDSLFDEPWVDNSRVPLSEFQGNAVDAALNGQNGNV